MKTMKLICGAVLAMIATFAAAAQDTPTASCMKQLAFEARLKPIADKVDLVQHNGNIWAPDRLATSEERAIVAVWADMRKGCFEYGDAHRRSISKPAEVAFQRSLFTFQQRLVVDLQLGKITYAEFSQRRAELLVAAGEEL
jgi:hypothetical protein